MFPKSWQRGAGCSAGAKLLSAQECGSDIGSGIAPKPLRCVLYIRWCFTSPQKKLSPVLRLGFIAGGAHSNVSGCVCLTMSIMFLFDYNLAEVRPLVFTFFSCRVSAPFSLFGSFPGQGLTVGKEPGWGTAPRTSHCFAFQQLPRPRLKFCANISIFIDCV